MERLSGLFRLLMDRGLDGHFDGAIVRRQVAAPRKATYTKKSTYTHVSELYGREYNSQQLSPSLAWIYASARQARKDPTKVQ